jgi:GNAT superfamily N-acetyltransferase
MEEELTLRVADLSHEQDVLVMARAFHAEDGHPLKESSPSAIRALLAGSPLGRIHLLQVGNEIAGYCAECFTMSLEFGGVVTIVDDLYLKPPYRGQGYGGRVLFLLEVEARARGSVQLFLEVENANIGARRLYERNGFSIRDRQMMEKLLQDL